MNDSHEDAVIGSLLAYPSGVPYAVNHFRAEMFQRANQPIFRAVASVFAKGEEGGTKRISAELDLAGHLAEVGGRNRLEELASFPVPPIVLPEYAKAFADRLATKQLSETLAALQTHLATPGASVSDVLSEGLTAMEDIAVARTPKVSPSMTKLAGDAITKIQQRAEGLTCGTPTGIASLDRVTGGIQPGSQWVIAGPPKGGKSSLALTLLASLAIRHGKRCALFGLEMPSVENIERLLCHEGRVPAEACRDGKLTERQMEALGATAMKIAGAPIHCRDDIFDLTEIISASRQLKAACPDLFAVFVDYAQLVSSPNREQNREREVAMVSRTLRKLSMQSGIAVILLSQTNDDGKLRESRTLGMDATKIVTIDFGQTASSRKLRLIQRDGMSGIELEVSYNGSFFQFADIETKP